MLRPLRVVAGIGAVTRLFSVTFLVPVLIALFYDPYDLQVGAFAIPRAVFIFMICFVTTYWLGQGLTWIAREVDAEDLQEREAYLTVGLGWLLLWFLSAAPFMMSGVLTNPFDALFEAMSGLTTTGATVMAVELESVTKSVMIWRGFLQFLGGMGIIVLSVALLARLTHGGLQLLQAEMPGPSMSRVAPRLAKTARSMWGVYLILAAALFVVLFLLLLRHDMGPKTVFYEALLHTFTGIATGGFSNHHASIAFFDDVWIEIAIIVFILLSGTNFTLHYLWMHGNFKPIWRDVEWRFYMFNFLVLAGLITFFLARSAYPIGRAIRESTFTTAAMMTSTGYVAADYDAWPAVTRFLILFMMVAGGSAGSTSGGLKFVRVLVLMKVAGREIKRLRHPRAVIPIRLGGRVLKPATIMVTVGFFFSYVALMVIGTLLLIAIDPLFSNPVDAVGASISALSNMGPALGVVGPTKTYAELTEASKAILSLLMWFGRLEIFTALLLLKPETWKH